MDALLRDVAYSFRRLRKSPVFTAIVLVTLALGIGANTAIFSVVNTVLLRPCPSATPGRSCRSSISIRRSTAWKRPISAAGFRDYRDKTSSFESVAVESNFGANLTGTGGDAERVPGERVSGDWFHVLGVAPQAGRVDPARRRPARTRTRRRHHGRSLDAALRAKAVGGGIDDRAERRIVPDHRRHARRVPRVLLANGGPVRAAGARARRVQLGLHQRVPELRRATQGGYHARARSGGDEAVRREPEEGESEPTSRRRGRSRFAASTISRQVAFAPHFSCCSARSASCC